MTQHTVTYQAWRGSGATVSPTAAAAAAARHAVHAAHPDRLAVVRSINRAACLRCVACRGRPIQEHVLSRINDEMRWNAVQRRDVFVE